MTDVESRTLVRAAGILLATSVLRAAWEYRVGESLFPTETGDALPQLLAVAESLEVATERRNTPMAPGETLDPNAAGEIELDRLPGVGAATAKSIVAAREQGTVFRRPEDLSLVRGIGERTAERMSPFLEWPGNAESIRRPEIQRPTAVGGAGSVGPGRLDLNNASEEELQSLSGIGPALAERILRYRAENGPFGSVEELTEVRGIGEATLSRLRPRIMVRR